MVALTWNLWPNMTRPALQDLKPPTAVQDFGKLG